MAQRITLNTIGRQGPAGPTGPAGPAGGSDAATAEHVTTGPLTSAALEAAFVSYAEAPTGVAPTDAANIAAAIAALPAEGGKVILKAGTYVGRFAIDRANVTLVGQGQGVTTLQLPDDAGVAQTLTIVSDFVTVSDLTIDGNAPVADPGNTRECDGISIYSSDVTIERCAIKDTMAHGIIVWNEATSTHNGAPNATAAAGSRFRHRIVNNRLENTGTTYESRSAIDIATTTDNQMSVVAFNTIIFGAGTASGVTMHSGSKCLILGNLIEAANTERAMMVHTGANMVQVIGNIVRTKVGATTGAQYMCTLANANDVLFLGNTFEHGAGVGALVKVDGTMTGISLVENIHRNTSASETDVSLIKCEATAAMTNFTAHGNKTTGHTTEVSGTVAQQAAVKLTEHYRDRAVVETSRLLRPEDAAQRIEIDVFMGRAVTTGTWTLSPDTANIYSGRLDSANVQNNEVAWDVSLTPGTWELSLMHTTNSNRGIYSVRLDGTEVGTIDGYSAAAVRNVISTVSFSVTTPGTHRLSLLMATIGGGGGYAGSPQHITLRRTA